MIKNVRDQHHVFLEGLKSTTPKLLNPKEGVTYHEFIMGS